jgi:sensor c-di-GMP phosphodiesterase-like protein
LAIVVSSLSAFCAMAHFAAEAVMEHQRSKQLEELTDVALRRTEVAIDFGAATLQDLLQRGPVNCDPVSLQAVRLQVYQRAAVKDIRLVKHDGSVICSAYSETLEFDNASMDRSGMLRSKDGPLLMFRLEQFTGAALGLLKDVDERQSLVAILGINSYLFDILPAELRSFGDVRLELNNGAEISHFALDPKFEPTSVASFQKESARYPVQAIIRIDQTALNGWHSEIYLPSILVGWVLGAAFGLLLMRATARLEGPIADIDRGLARNEFRPFYQPTFDLQSGHILGCEVLARWMRKDGTVVPPTSFIPLAESSGRIEIMTWQILKLALSEMQPRLREDKRFKMSFNVAPSHLLSDDFIPALRRLVAGSKVATRQIVLEITEQNELPDLERAALVVQELRNLGFKVAMDDVGVGHSGLSQIKGLGADTIKIDKFFVDTVTEGASAATIVTMLSRLARDLQMTVIAEGIETADQVKALLACGVEEGQGYFVSPPIPFAAFEKLLNTRATAAARFVTKVA